ncbi:MAG: lamin tail domain-containing protein [Kiritimatiellia bacterium]|jgi:hypothetical protein|nr:lamin tail domain-containing protein [Kiritimatiellia bacterium]
MRTTICLFLLLSFLPGVGASAHADTNRYLFVGHPRDDGPGQIVQREVERIDYSQYGILMLGGDYTPSGTGSRDTVAYLDAIFDLGSSNVLAALGNHDTSHRSYFTDVTLRPAYYAYTTNNVTFVVLDTTDDSQNIEDEELQMLEDTVNNSLSNSTHLVLIHHHIIWMADYPPLSHLIGDRRIGASSKNLNNLNFYDDVYPLLVQARSNGVEVICLAGDRTGYGERNAPEDHEEFHIEHTTSNGVHYLAAGRKEDIPANLRTVIELTHDTDTDTIGWEFLILTNLPRIPDEPVVVTELHYDPNPDNSTAFIELMNRGTEPYDVSDAEFETGMNDGDFTFPDDTILAPGERVIIAADASHYTGLTVRVFDYPGSNKLDSDDPIWLRDSDELEIDYVDYGISSPWPSEPDNTGPSLVLIHPDLDNELPENWAVSDYDGGTPGGTNFVPPAPAGIAVSSNEIAIEWEGIVSNAHYRLDWSPTLTPPDWQPVASSAVADVTTLMLTDTNAAPQRFYRLSREFNVE